MVVEMVEAATVVVVKVEVRVEAGMEEEKVAGARAGEVMEPAR